MSELEHSCDENCQECRTDEWLAAHFGYPAVTMDGIMMTRVTAQKYADGLIGRTLSDFTGNGLEVIQARVIATRLEDDTPDGSKGRVIAICEPVSQPYRPNMEYK